MDIVAGLIVVVALLLYLSQPFCPYCRSRSSTVRHYLVGEGCTWCGAMRNELTGKWERWG